MSLIGQIIAQGPIGRAAIPRWAQNYLRMDYAAGGREKPYVDCYGLCYVIIWDRLGIHVDEFAGEGGVTVARALAKQRKASTKTWDQVPFGEEQCFDVLIMQGLVGSGLKMRGAPIHCGLILSPGMVMDIDRDQNVMIRSFRDTEYFKGHPKLVNRVIAIYRNRDVARALAD